jgi:hypothetical protein
MELEPIPRYLFLRLVIIWAGAFPIFYGAAGLLSAENLVRISEVLSQGSTVLTPEMQYLIKPLSLYVLMFGALLMVAAVDPERYRGIIIWAAILFFMRGLQRLSITDELNQLFGMPAGRNLMHVGYLFLLAAVLWLLRPKAATPAAPPTHLEKAGCLSLTEQTCGTITVD